MKLHNYFRSSTSFRARIALNLKGLNYDYVPWHLKNGEQRSGDYLAVNPHGLVPALELDNGKVLGQSLAIIEYLDELHPTPPLLPGDAWDRARIRSIAYTVACDIHPINNLRILQYLADPLGHDAGEVAVWFRTWVGVEFAALEKRLAGDAETGEFCHGDSPTLADICLVAQVVNNRRFDVDMTPYPTLNRVFDNAMALPAFAQAAPMEQPDAE